MSSRHPLWFWRRLPFSSSFSPSLPPLLLFMQFIFGSYVVICPPPTTLCLPAFLVSSLSHRCHLSLRALFVCFSSPPHLFCVHIVYCNCLLFPTTRLNSCKGHMSTQIDAPRGPQDNTQQGNPMHCCFAHSHLQLMMQHHYTDIKWNQISTLVRADWKWISCSSCVFYLIGEVMLIWRLLIFWPLCHKKNLN